MQLDKRVKHRLASASTAPVLCPSPGGTPPRSAPEPDRAPGSMQVAEDAQQTLPLASAEAAGEGSWGAGGRAPGALED